MNQHEQFFLMERLPNTPFPTKKRDGGLTPGVSRGETFPSFQASRCCVCQECLEFGDSQGSDEALAQRFQVPKIGKI